MHQHERRSAMTVTAHQALVLNADFRPMSYFPLSLLSWQDAVHAVFSERVSVVAEYDTWARSPSTPVPLHLPVLRRGVCLFGADVRARHSALARRSDDVVEYRHRLRAVQHGQGQ